ncbi:MAG: SLC13 family permease [Actinobacteria bacterium]|nr:SLC13 family permease [Actinomycetota bacterium]
MSWEAWYTLAVLAAVLGFLIRGRVSAAVAVFGGNIALLAVGVIDTEQSLAGFSNPAPLTVAALYVVAAGVQKTGALTPLLHGALGSNGNGRLRRPIARLSIPAAGASTFLNNTPIVAMAIPEIQSWADKRSVSVSKLLMPISFAVILGGLLSVIGTSTNLVVSGLMENAGLGAMGFFEIGKVGLPIAILGITLMVIISAWVLPARRSVAQEMAEQAREFYVELLVQPGGPLDGTTVEHAGLRDLQGVFLTSVDRGDTVIAPVRPETVLRGGNRLRFAGQASKVLDLQGRKGLESAESEHVEALDDPSVRYFEAVIGSRSPLVGSTLKESGFRSTYQAAVVGIHRDGGLIEAKLGQVRLRVGDTLILVSDPGFKARWDDREDFLLVAAMNDAPSAPVSTAKAWVAIAILAGIIGLATFNVVPIIVGALVGAMLMVALGVLSATEARRSIDIEVIVIIAAAFGLASAMENTGLAESAASGIVSVFGGWGDWGALLGIVLATVVLTEMITNNAAALLMFPIGLSLAAGTDLNPVGVAIAIAVAASASFLTPIGYQTNTMVYGPGGYRFSDYWRLGLPLTITVVIATVVLVPIIWP